MAFQGAWATVAWSALAQMLINVYPIMHLRLTRRRLERAARSVPLHRHSNR